MSSFYLLILNGAAVTLCAVFGFAWRTPLLTGLLLFLPFLDRQWRWPELKLNRTRLAIYGLLLLMGLILVAGNKDYAIIAVSALLLTALPEEWFFRAYFMRRLQAICNSPVGANIATSALFALLHIPTQGWFGLTVFFPSLVYGWLYQRSNDLILVVLIHALSNLVFFIYLADRLPASVRPAFP